LLDNSTPLSNPKVVYLPYAHSVDLWVENIYKPYKATVMKNIDQHDSDEGYAKIKAFLVDIFTVQDIDTPQHLAMDPVYANIIIKALSTWKYDELTCLIS
jgi:hypothetical protein